MIKKEDISEKILFCTEKIANIQKKKKQNWTSVSKFNSLPLELNIEHANSQITIPLDINIEIQKQIFLNLIFEK